jgi:hypothetical protein
MKHLYFALLYLLIVAAGSVACLVCPFIVGFTLWNVNPVVGALSGVLAAIVAWPMIYFNVTWVPDVLRSLNRAGI